MYKKFLQTIQTKKRQSKKNILVLSLMPGVNLKHVNNIKHQNKNINYTAHVL